MKGLVLGNKDYELHMTSEGEHLQRGLVSAGWDIAGFGYGDGCSHVPTLLDRYTPNVVLISDCRDWLPSEPGCYDKRVAFTGYQKLRNCGAYVVTPLKDAGSCAEVQDRFAHDIGAHALVTYYHDSSVLTAGPWAVRYPLIRTYHSVDADVVRTIDIGRERAYAVVTGARNPTVYPLRERVFARAEDIGLDTLPHPGYGNTGCRTPEYLRTLAGYKVHVKTASQWGFALRGIIESVAVGTACVTDLPHYDALPYIDDVLYRVPADTERISLAAVGDEVARAARQWDALGVEGAEWWSKRALSFYDYRAAGLRLSEAIFTEWLIWRNKR